MSLVSLEIEHEETVTDASSVIDLTVYRECIRRISQSRHFSKAPLLSSFLVHVCERTLAAPADRITEYEIGVRVFRRSASFDPRQDNIVRTYARQLRKRLEEFYSTDGSGETLRILLPKGGYTPIFERWPQDVAKPLDEQSPDEKRLDDLPPMISEPSVPSETLYPATESSGKAEAWTLRVGLSALLCSLLLLGATLHLRNSEQRRTENARPLHVLWTQLFSSGRDTFLIPGDVGFVIMQQANRRTFTLAEYLGWQAANHAPDKLAMSYLKDQSYTSMLNLDTVSQLQRLPEISPQHFIPRAPRALRLEDLQSSNAILLGSNFSNPWTELFSSQLNFHFMNDPANERNWIVNRAPAPGERAVYEDTVRSYVHPTYGVIAFLPNLSKKGHVLLVEGLDAAGTKAAVDLLFEDTDTMRAFLAQTIRTDGSIRSFEVLVEATSFGYDSRAADDRILAKRIYR